jgi:merlin protein
VDESEWRAAEADRLKDELLNARLAEKQAQEKLLEFLSRNAYNNITVSMKVGFEQIAGIL